ncbi:outer membrane vitamin B12 receptor BtuB [Enterovibrio coralii]|uniref:Outer membrane vitamin B12 receptor BtuB n=1 Tax=Enterovibrio coralii TaxID=294935 RepID=A0A135IAX3_9GAMM|nr:outer membrane vitamin B12 receptor BtuB [Enterovibrio coralii]
MAAFAHAESISSSADDAMVVTASRFEQPVSTVLAPVSVLTRTDLEELQANSLVDALKTLPGIEIGQSGGRGQNASIFLRGTESRHVLVLVDGVRLPRTMLGTIDFNMLPLNTVERIEVIRGSGATVYGSDAIGGVINIITRNNAEATRFSMGGGSFGTASADLGVTRKLTDSLSMQLMGGMESVDGYNVRPSDENVGDKHGFESKNVSLRLSYVPSENWNSNVIGRWYQNEVEYDSYGSKQKLWVESSAISADSGYTSGKWNTLARLEVGQQKNYDFADGLTPSADNLNSEIRQIYSSLTSRYQARDNLAVTTGVDLTLEKYLDGNFISIDSIEDNPRQNIGVFGLVNWNITDSILLEASSRYDDNDQFGDNTTSMVAAGWTINEDYRLFASYGTAFKAPGFDKLYGWGGNAKLKPEESENIEVGLEGTTYNVGWSLNGYINTIDNLIISRKDSSGEYVNENVEEARIKGIELTADFDLGPVYNQVSLELRDPKDLSKNEQLARRAKEVAKWRTSVWLGDVLLGTQFMYQGERPNFSGGGMLDAYSVWDLTAQYDISNNITLGGKVANLFDEEYETAGDYPAAERAFYVNLNFAY